MILRFCMSPDNRHSGTPAISSQVTVGRSDKIAFQRHEQIALAVERNFDRLADGLVVEIGNADIGVEILQKREDFVRCMRGDADLRLREMLRKRRGEAQDHRQDGRDHRQPQMTRQSLLQHLDFGDHRPGVADDAPGPFENPLAFRREALEARAAVHQSHAERRFQLLDGQRKVGLGNAAGFGGVAEMLFLGQRQQIFKLIVHVAPTGRICRQQLAQRRWEANAFLWLFGLCGQGFLVVLSNSYGRDTRPEPVNPFPVDRLYLKGAQVTLRQVQGRTGPRRLK
jgi:hypothetical protein